MLGFDIPLQEEPLKLASLQMNACPAPLLERLARAEGLVASAARDGAELVLLPELFNTGYAYTDLNYQLAEPLDGPTASWMKNLASQYQVYLAGAFLRRSGQEIYDTLLLVSPQGEHWLYDKNYPWMWERAYFRPGRGIRVAETALGRIGLLVCWDAAHPALWRQYAGKVQLMLVSSCPPAVQDLSLVLPGGQRIPRPRLGPFMRWASLGAEQTFGSLLLRQSSWLGVPVLQAMGTGLFHSPFPRPRLSMITLALTCQRLWKIVPQAEQVRIEAGYFNESYAADAYGQILSQVPPGVEGYTIAEMKCPVSPPQPSGPQPRFGLSAAAYGLDAFANLIFGLFPGKGP